MQRELRHVSGTTTLDELGRVLSRNKFALVDQTKIVTTSDLLAAMMITMEKPVVKAKDDWVHIVALALTGMLVSSLTTYFIMKK